jgi:hypothetical protein
MTFIGDYVLRLKNGSAPGATGDPAKRFRRTPARDAVARLSPLTDKDQPVTRFVLAYFPDTAVVIHGRMPFIIPVDIRVTAVPSEGVPHCSFSLRKCHSGRRHQAPKKLKPVNLNDESSQESVVLDQQILPEGRLGDPP